MRRFIHAIQFLTIFPVKKDLAHTPQDLAGSMAWFPLVGALQGAILVLSYYVLSTLFPESLTAGLLILILVLTNGGLHLDGFADTVDGLAGGKTPEDRLRIMRDSATGAIGVVFVVLILLIKFLAVQELPYEAKAQALFLFPVVGRWAMVPMAYWSPYARATGGVGSVFASNSRKTLFKATMVTVALSALLLGVLSLVIIALLAVIIYLFASFFRKKIGGVTGDVFGFQSEVAEVFFLAAVIAMLNILSLAEE